MPDPFPYYQYRQFTTTLAGHTIRMVSKSGLPYGNEISPATHLLAETVRLKPEGQTLLLGCESGALGCALAPQAGMAHLEIADTNFLALRMGELTLQANDLGSVPCHPLGTSLPSETFDTIVIRLPKGRKLARRWLVEAASALRPEGELYLAGANPEGIQSVAKDAQELFGNTTILGYKKGSRAVRMTKPTGGLTWPGWAKAPGIGSGSWYEFEITAQENTFHLRSLPGVFSYDQLDEGTALVLDNLNISVGERVLDFGCGFGIIGLCAARSGAAWVDLIDVDLWAVASAQENLLANHVPNGCARPSDVLEAVTDQRYHLIVSNPPFHAGQATEYAIAHTLIAHARQLLEPGGRLVIVANRFLRYNRLILDIFGNATPLAETGKYHVLEGRA